MMEQEQLKELPIGRQTFSELIEEDLLYVDKTKYVWDLVREGKFYFLSRPRRFGKSLLLSTLKSFFEGREDLFRGLYIHGKVKEWKQYPVVYIDYSLVEYKKGSAIFEKSLLEYLQSTALKNELEIQESIIPNFFRKLIELLYSKYGQVVVLIDEYDKPLVDLLSKEYQFKENQEVLRGLYGNLKSLDPYLRFVMLTGVSRFSKVGIFSGLNNLDDISLSPAFVEITGFSSDDLSHYFAGYIDSLKANYKMEASDLMKDIKLFYNGFSWDGIHKLYNPFSILKLMKDQRFDYYWFSTGTPSFLIDLVKEQKHLPENFENQAVTDLEGSASTNKAFPLLPLLFQTGYLTIAKRERIGVRDRYYLNYPNEEVRFAFLTHLVASFVQKEQFYVQPEVFKLKDALEDEHLDQFLQVLRSFLADIPFQIHLPKEAYYHSLIGMLFKLIGVQTFLEKPTNKGRIDMVLELTNKVYIIEFKFATNKRIKRIKTLVNQAMKQIEAKEYYEAYLSSDKKIILLGLGFLHKKVDGKMKVLDLQKQLS